MYYVELKISPALKKHISKFTTNLWYTIRIYPRTGAHLVQWWWCWDADDADYADDTDYADNADGADGDDPGDPQDEPAVVAKERKPRQLFDHRFFWEEEG